MRKVDNECDLYIGCIKSPETVEHLKSKAFLRKMFRIKFIGFKKIYSLITSV